MAEQILIERDDESGGWIATSPTTPGLVVGGKTLEEVGRKCDICLPALHSYAEGDLVVHQNCGPGVVTRVDDNGTVHVTYEKADDKGRHWMGQYNRVWFRNCGNLLTKVERK